MSDGTGGGGEKNRQLPDEAALFARLRRLGERLDQHQPKPPSGNAPGSQPSASGSAMARGLRLSSELVAGVVVGAVIGYMLDRIFGISPWGLIVFLLLGFAAGVLNVMRAAGVVQPIDPGGK